MIIKRQFKMYNITIHNTQHLCLVESVAKHSVRYNGVLHFDPASLSLHPNLKRALFNTLAAPLCN